MKTKAPQHTAPAPPAPPQASSIAPGVTLRDYFAAHAMPIMSDVNDPKRYAAAAMASFAYAEAMIAARGPNASGEHPSES